MAVGTGERDQTERRREMLPDGVVPQVLQRLTDQGPRCQKQSVYRAQQAGDHGHLGRPLIAEDVEVAGVDLELPLGSEVSDGDFPPDRTSGTGDIDRGTA